VKIEIRHRFTADVLFSIETDSWKLAVEAPIKAKANLTSADLRYADLRYANSPVKFFGALIKKVTGRSTQKRCSFSESSLVAVNS
jgi:hypothetical protein